MRNIEWLKEIINVNSYETAEGRKVLHKDTSVLLHWLDQLDRPESPVIPDYVAEYIVETKVNTKFTIFKVLEDLHSTSEDRFKSVVNWVFKNEQNENSFSLAWILDDWEIEEKQYLVNSNGGEPLLAKYFDEVIEYEFERNAHTTFKLTEKEIKGFDPRYWAFKKEVTE